MSKGILFVVSAPSGAGKTTLSNMAVDSFPSFRHSISYTTRAPREGEVDGVDYRFISDGDYDAMVSSDGFVEHATVHGNRYGTGKDDLTALLKSGADVMMDIDVQGAEQIRRSFEDRVSIFIVPPSMEACAERLHGRDQDTPETIKKRLAVATSEIKEADKYDYIIINDDLDEAFEKLKSVVTAEKSRTGQLIDPVRAIFD